MDIEFHYYQTYLIAVRAGFAPADAFLIAHSAQGVDDNHIPVQITAADGTVYRNQISQTMDILRPHQDALIYPIFHFIPGDPKASSAARVDGLEDTWVTTPNGALANRMIDAALASGDLYRIGVSAHGYVDTWAHQNFLGRRDRFNEFGEHHLLHLLDEALAVGHARAGHQPDWPGLVWNDSRLSQPQVINKDRFLDAAAHLFSKFARHLNPSVELIQLDAVSRSLVADLAHDIGAEDPTNRDVAERIARYLARSLEPAYGASKIPAYSDGQWFGEAIQEDHDTVEKNAMGNDSFFDDLKAFTGDFLADRHRQQVRWKNPDPNFFRNTHWFRFNQAVKSHLDECQAMLEHAGIAPASTAPLAGV